jgi:hypothetical protein
MPSPKPVRRRVDISELGQWVKFELFHGAMSTDTEILVSAWRRHREELLQT